jgi:hypothetical protein
MIADANGVSSMPRRSPLAAIAITISVVLAGEAGILPVSAKQNCADDLNKLSKRREAALKVLNDIVKAYQGQALPPEIFCPSFADLESTVAPLLVFMITNKDSCKIPDAAIDGLRDNMAKTHQFGQRYCS